MIDPRLVSGRQLLLEGELLVRARGRRRAVLGYALEGSQSMITSGALEMSNVDLAQEFTSMIVAQRGFQANGKIISTSDEMLQELMSIKR